MARIPGPATATGGDPAAMLQILTSARNPDGTQYTLPVESAPPGFTVVLTSGVLLPAGGAVESAWFDADALRAKLLHVERTATGGTYVLEVDWSRDGATVDVTETLTPGDRASLTKDVAARFFRVRVRNTDAVSAFTTHRTSAFAR